MEEKLPTKSDSGLPTFSRHRAMQLLTEDNAGVVADAFAVSGRPRTVLLSSCTLKPNHAGSWLLLQNIYTVCGDGRHGGEQTLDPRKLVCYCR